MKTLPLACAVIALAVATGANATTTVFDFSLAPHQGDIGPTQTYTAGGLSIFAAGFTSAGVATDLYGKHDGGDENGLGLNNDPSGQHEIHYQSGFVQLDLSGLVGHVVAGSTTFGTNSVSEGEAWTVYGTNASGSLSGAIQLATGTNEAVNQALSGLGTYRYFDFVETSQLGGENFLITNIATQAVPEPASWALMLLGFGGLGALLRRRRTADALAA
jgi:hypothetical protein